MQIIATRCPPRRAFSLGLVVERRPLLDKVGMINVRDRLVVLWLAVWEEGRGEDAPEGVDQGDGQKDNEEKSEKFDFLQ